MSSIELYSSQKGENVPPFGTALPQPQGFSVEVNFSSIDVIFQISQTSSKAGYQNIFWDLSQSETEKYFE